MIRRLIIAFALAAGIAPAFAQAPPPVPALPDTERRTSYTISGSTCACAVNFALYGDSTDVDAWLEVWVAGTRYLSSDPTFGWTLTSPTGSLATISRPITDAVLTFNAVHTGTVQIVGARRPRRVTQFSENRGVAARDLNQALTDIIAQNRETWDKINDVSGRAVVAPPGETLTVLPQKSNRAGFAFCFDTNGNPAACVSVPSTTFVAGTGITFTGSNPTTISINQAGITGPLNLTSASSLTLNNLVGLTIQDAASSQDIGSIGTASSVQCDPGLIGAGLPGNGPCTQLNFTPNSTASAWQTLLLQATNSKVIIAAKGGVGNPEMLCADTNVFGIPVWGGGNQSGCGFIEQARTGSGQPVVYDFVSLGVVQTAIVASLATGISGNGKLTVTSQSGPPIVFGMTIVGAGISPSMTITGTATTGSGNCSPACTGTGGTGTYATSLSTAIGSENMVGGASSAESSMSVQIWGGSLDGLTQNILMFFNSTGCSAWTSNVCVGTSPGSRLGEVAGTGMTPVDGLFTQTETASVNFYADATWSGTSHLDNHYTAPSNIVMRIAYLTNSPETIVGGWYNPGTLAVGAWAANGNGFTGGAGSITLKDGASITGNMSGATILGAISGQLQISSSVTGLGAFVLTQTGGGVTGFVPCFTANGIVKKASTVTAATGACT